MVTINYNIMMSGNSTDLETQKKSKPTYSLEKKLVIRRLIYPSNCRKPRNLVLLKGG